MDKRPIVVVENDRSWLEVDLKRLIVEECGFEGDIIDVTQDWGSPRGLDCLRASQLAIVDLELGASTGGGHTDMRGRDEVLPVFRKEARWVPIVLMSQYVTSNDFLLADLTPSDFDAVVGKRFITDSRTIPNIWRRFVRSCSLRRVASLTGRSMNDLSTLLAHCPDLDFGNNVRQQISGWPEQGFREVLALLDLGAPRLVIDKLVQGFSGVLVFRVVAEEPGASRKWLLKISRNSYKVDGEARAHRRMVRDGLTRLVTVPLLWPAAVCWNSCAAIAYEFQEDAETLLETASRVGVDAGLDLVADALALLYRGAFASQVVPRTHLRSLAPRGGLADVSGGAYERVVRPAVAEEECGRLDVSKRLMVGRVHGDLHARNILVSDGRGVLIDFAHFKSATERGVPLSDLAKLLVDLRAFASAWWTPESLISGSLLDDARIAALLRRIGAIEADQPSSGEREFFADSCACIMASYLNYDDVPSTVGDSFRAALSADLPT